MDGKKKAENHITPSRTVTSFWRAIKQRQNAVTQFEHPNKVKERLLVLYGVLPWFLRDFSKLRLRPPIIFSEKQRNWLKILLHMIKDVLNVPKISITHFRPKSKLRSFAFARQNIYIYIFILFYFEKKETMECYERLETSTLTNYLNWLYYLLIHILV